MKWLVLLLLCTSCAIPSYTIDGKVKVFDRQVDTKMTQEQAQMLFQYAFSHTFLFAEDFRDWDFVFTSSWYGVPLKDGRIALVDGMTIMKDKVIFLKVHECYGDSALIHELAHVYRAWHGETEDREHKDREFWNTEAEMTQEMIDALCPKGYMRVRTIPNEVVWDK